MTRPHSLHELAEITNSKLVGESEALIEGVADLQSATPTQVSFLAKAAQSENFKSYYTAMLKSQAGAVFVDPEIQLPPKGCFLVNADPSRAFQLVVELFRPPIRSGFTGIHPTAVVHEEATVGKEVTIGPNAVIDRGVTIGDRTHIGAQVFIGAETQVGSDCFLHPGAVVREGSQLGNRVILQPGAVIGSCGFGYTSDTGVHKKLEQLGRVVLEDDVEIGAHAAIDRARFHETRVAKGTKIDNLVQIAHGVQVGQHCLIVGQVGVAGSTKIGNHVIIAGQVAVNGHIEITDQVMIGARSAVLQSIKEPGKYIGEPAIPYADFRRRFMHLLRIERYAKRIDTLEKRIKELEAAAPSSQES